MDGIEFFATTSAGIEDLASSEVEMLLKVKCVPDVGKVFFKSSPESIYILNLCASTLNKVMICLCRTYFENLNQIYYLVKQVDFSKYILPDQSFAVESERYGVHDFTSVDVSRVVGQAIIDSYLSSKGVRLKVNLNSPDIIFFSLVRDKEYILGLNTTGESLHKRGYRVYEHPAALKPTIASAMLMLAGWDCSMPLIDPMCGGATIPIEAAFKARRIPPNYLRKNFAFHKIGFLNLQDFENLRGKLLSTANRNVYKIFGMEKYERHLRGAIMNCSNAGVSDTVFLKLGDATCPEMYPCESFNTIIVNPPYGVRMVPEGGMKRFYKLFLKALRERFSGSTLVLITAAFRRFLQAVDEVDVKVLGERNVLHGRLSAKIFKCKI
ncbi:MAG: class I SAM-dependent RNA methyltransferase [Nitrososphaeria archaeon]|nr:class I SAM-dependent RNA methyltransferase [Nitrososphaeria archaeon]